MNVEQIFQKANFVHEYRKEIEEFYRPYFPDDEAMEAFFVSIFLNEDEERKPRQMMNQIQRFVTLANDIDKIRPGRDPLRILFLRICLESLCEISGSNKKSFYESFERFFSDDGKSYILQNFTFSDISVPDTFTGWDKLLFNSHEGYEMAFTDFMRIIRAVRNNLVHDGDYWTMQFFARDSDSTWLVDMQTDEKIIECQEKGDVLTYNFETTMQYEKFIAYFVDACIKFVVDYMETKYKPDVLA